jgi:hypothetical protein
MKRIQKRTMTSRSRLRRPMCGTALPSVDRELILRAYAPFDLGHSPKIEKELAGKSIAFRTSGGRAAKRKNERQ